MPTDPTGAEPARHVRRDACITCRGTTLSRLSSGRYADPPLRDVIDAAAFGADPRPHLKDAVWELVRCDACDQVFHAEILDDHWLGVLYSQWMSAESIAAFEATLVGSAAARAFGGGVHDVERLLQIERLTADLRGDDRLRVLDFGCGDGRFVSIAAAFGCEAVGIEISAARDDRRLAQFYPTLDDMDAHRGTAPFHAAVLFEVLEHLPAPRDVLDQVAARLMPGAVLLLETPDCTGVHDLQSVREVELLGPLGHLNGFTPATLARIANEAGFDPVTPPTAWVGASPARALKRLGRHALRPVLRPYTQLAFRKR